MLKYHSNCHILTPLLKNFLGGMPTDPPSFSFACWPVCHSAFHLAAPYGWSWLDCKVSPPPIPFANPESAPVYAKHIMLTRDRLSLKFVINLLSSFLCTVKPNICTIHSYNRLYYYRLWDLNSFICYGYTLSSQYTCVVADTLQNTRTGSCRSVNALYV